MADIQITKPASQQRLPHCDEIFAKWRNTATCCVIAIKPTTIAVKAIPPATGIALQSPMTHSVGQ